LTNPEIYTVTINTKTFFLTAGDRVEKANALNEGAVA
jgi:hypothetical protein